MSNDEIKRIFFELLTEDEDFQKRLTEFIIKAVVEKFGEQLSLNEEPPKVEEVEPVAEQENSSDDLQTELDDLRRQKELVDSQLDDLRHEKELADRQLDDLRRQKELVDSQLDDLRHEKELADRQLDDLRRQKELADNQLDDLRHEKELADRQLDDLRRQKELADNQLDDLRRQKELADRQLDDLRRQKELADRQLDDLRRQKELAENERDNLKQQLAARFPEGWEVYKTFLNIDEMTRKDSGLRTENFESFICSGSQQRRLDGIWEAALLCKREGQSDHAEIFWKVFTYCVRLVNAAFDDNIIEILDTQIGDRYDNDKHSTSGTNSSTQGVVREIILAGYRNNTSRKIVKKSNVRVG